MKLKDIGTIEADLIGTRILPLEGQTPLPIEVGGVEIEHTFRGVGKIQGIGLAETFTSKSIFSPGYWAVFELIGQPLPSELSGFYESQSNGIWIVTDVTNNSERITWTGHGIGLPYSPASSKHLGVVFCRTSSAKTSLAKQFNGLIAVVETYIRLDPADDTKRAIKATRKFWQIKLS
ncbi:MAG: hypothetical protein LUQ47_00285 [Methanotrichaceae archaeon]|nr:hypothetical protein [Methanotrichaceae archaeon]